MAVLNITSFHTALWILFTFLASAVAQSPSNDSLPTGHYYTLQTNSDGMSYKFALEALTEPARLGAQQHISGTLVLATPDTVDSLIRNSIVCISCDSESYSGQRLDAEQTVSLAGNSSPVAIVLFTNTSSSCDYKGDPSSYFYSTTNANTSDTLLRTLQMDNSAPGQGLIKSAKGDDDGPNGSSVSTNGGSYDGHSPTTAVAMIILYSITGIITALFLIIIVVGAVRAHRHPERYGPRNIMGRPRQSRARGIARAMLETIPIVKFGEKEDDKPGQEGSGGDVELAQTPRDAPADPTPTVEVHRPSTEQPAQTEPQDGGHPGPEVVTTEKASAAETVPDGRTSTDANADNGLACSVCTDDFTKGQDVRVLPCNHKFHPECIDPWLLNVSGTCPLCRVDLRPTTSNPADPENPDFDDITHDIDEAGASTEHVEENSAQDRRRSRTGTWLHLHHHLNRRRMRDATPEERVAALRRLRTANNEGDNDSTRNRLSARLSRAFNHDSRRGSFLNPENRSRRGSALNPESGSVNSGSRPVSAVIPENGRGTYAG